ncbi:hypothetical protein [Mesomycoplasma neurolyticum]|uniref:Uncharacterized protein n=1 Tax=Mesomycoplasma neurolyticum TaxID=2120 RepID=A0A449A5I8_9BACT|nr:hypothetical protein [Mesomycoplasma neurolyticum]VEU59550.1 Uncharacterised protein [Mesomycoplasma neurolyticum]
MIIKRSTYLKITGILNIILFVIFIFYLSILVFWLNKTTGIGLVVLLMVWAAFFIYFLVFLFFWVTNIIKLSKKYNQYNKKGILLWMIFPFVSLFQKEKVSKILSEK